MAPITEGTVHKIVSDIIGGVEGRHQRLLEAHTKEIDEVKDDISSVKIELKGISTKLDAIYGNGSGKKGILEGIVEEQKAIKDFQAEENKQQETFRQEVKNHMETVQILEAAKVRQINAVKEVNSSWRSWIKWVIGGLGIVLFEMLKPYLHTLAVNILKGLKGP